MSSPNLPTPPDGLYWDVKEWCVSLSLTLYEDDGATPIHRGAANVPIRKTDAATERDLIAAANRLLSRHHDRTDPACIHGDFHGPAHGLPAPPAGMFWRVDNRSHGTTVVLEQVESARTMGSRRLPLRPSRRQFASAGRRLIRRAQLWQRACARAAILADDPRIPALAALPDGYTWEITATDRGLYVSVALPESIPWPRARFERSIGGLTPIWRIRKTMRRLAVEATRFGVEEEPETMTFAGTYGKSEG